MTITFYCPNCDELIAFEDKHIGKRARCQSCGQVLIIPSQSEQVPQAIESEQAKAEPLEGFYRALFINTWKIFVDWDNVTPLVFVISLVCFKFFLARGLCCIKPVTYLLVWGWLLGFYLNVIYETAFEIDKLPQIFIGSFLTFLWYAMKPFLIFLFTLVVVQLPFFITLAIFKSVDPSFSNLWQLEFGWRLIPQIFFIVSLFFFPIAILTMAVGQDFSLLNPRQFLKPIRGAIGPYVVIFCLLGGFCVAENFTKQYTGATVAVTAGYLSLNLLVQLIAIFAMRAIGLFYRHYNCHLAW